MRVNPLEIFVGNDSGLWRSTDAIGESGPVCASSDASHFQNLNGSLGSLAEVESLSQAGATPYTMMAGLGANGTAGVKSTTGADGGLAGDSGRRRRAGGHRSHQQRQLVCEQRGGRLHLPVLAVGSLHPGGVWHKPRSHRRGCGRGWADDDRAGALPGGPAGQLAVADRHLPGVARAANGVGWSAANAISPMLDERRGGPCSGDALIRSMAALPLAASAALPSGGEVVYVGMYGSANGGATLPGHVSERDLQHRHQHLVRVDGRDALNPGHQRHPHDELLRAGHLQHLHRLP